MGRRAVSVASRCQVNRNPLLDDETASKRSKRRGQARMGVYHVSVPPPRIEKCLGAFFWMTKSNRTIDGRQAGVVRDETSQCAPPVITFRSLLLEHKISRKEREKHALIKRRPASVAPQFVSGRVRLLQQLMRDVGAHWLMFFGRYVRGGRANE